MLRWRRSFKASLSSSLEFDKDASVSGVAKKESSAAAAAGFLRDTASPNFGASLSPSAKSGEEADFDVKMDSVVLSLSEIKELLLLSLSSCELAANKAVGCCFCMLKCS